MEQDYDYLFRRRHALHRENREVWERSRAAYYRCIRGETVAQAAVECIEVRMPE